MFMGLGLSLLLEIEDPYLFKILVTPIPSKLFGRTSNRLNCQNHVDRFQTLEYAYVSFLSFFVPS